MATVEILWITAGLGRDGDTGGGPPRSDRIEGHAMDPARDIAVGLSEPAARAVAPAAELEARCTS